VTSAGNPPPKGTPPAAQPGGAAPDSTPAPESAAPGAAPDSGSTSAPDPAPASTPADPAPDPTPSSAPADPAPDPAPASAPADPAADSAPASTPPDSTPPSSAPPSSGGCAEIPTAAHAVLEADIKLIVQLPTATDPNQPPGKLTLSNEDGSYSKVLNYPADCQPGDTDGSSVMTFDGMTDGHTYSLQYDDGSGSPYYVFQSIAYDQLVPKLAQSGDPATPSSAPSDPAGGSSGDPDAGAGS
jgi:hypothetical protein